MYLRMKSKFLISILVACLILSVCGLAYAAGLTDVSGHWAKTQIEKMVSIGAVKGYPDGSFKPDKQITRAEFTTIVNQAFKKFNKDAKAGFADVKESDWYFSQVASGKIAGFISGYTDNTFKPNRAITRAEAASILAELKDLDTSKTDVADKFTDAADIAGWAKGKIAAVTTAKIMSGYPDGSFKANNPITRAEAVVAVDKAMGASTPVVSGGGGGSNPTPTLPSEVERYVAVIDPFGDTLVKVFVKSSAAASVKVVKVQGQVATNVAGTNEWRVTLDGNKSIVNSDVTVIAVTEIKNVTDPFNDTLVKVVLNVDASGVKVKGQDATKVGNTREWRVTLEGQQTITAADITVN